VRATLPFPTKKSNDGGETALTNPPRGSSPSASRRRVPPATDLPHALNASTDTPGTLTNGSKFDSSKDRGQPFQFTIGMGQVIKGWDEGMMKMSVGQTAKLTCTPDYAYGERGFPPVIPPASTLIFEVELLGVK